MSVVVVRSKSACPRPGMLEGADESRPFAAVVRWSTVRASMLGSALVLAASAAFGQTGAAPTGQKTLAAPATVPAQPAQGGSGAPTPPVGTATAAGNSAAGPSTPSVEARSTDCAPQDAKSGPCKLMTKVDSTQAKVATTANQAAATAAATAQTVETVKGAFKSFADLFSGKGASPGPAPTQAPPQPTK
jgi:hypothetical protein